MSMNKLIFLEILMFCYTIKYYQSHYHSKEMVAYLTQINFVAKLKGPI